MRELTKDDLLKYKNLHYMTVGRLREFLDDTKLPDDAIVVIERVQDVYYEKHNWGAYLHENDHTRHMRHFNRCIENGTVKDIFDGIEDDTKPYTEEEIKDAMTQYHPAWCAWERNDDDQIMFIDLHY